MNEALHDDCSECLSQGLEIKALTFHPQGMLGARKSFKLVACDNHLAWVKCSYESRGAGPPSTFVAASNSARR
jgi:hypothetical protein